jgi:hypothetical protein
VAVSCECGNEHSGSINAGIYWLAEYLLAYQDGLCSMEVLMTDNDRHRVRYFVLLRVVVVVYEAVLNVRAMHLF